LNHNQHNTHQKDTNTMSLSIKLAAAQAEAAAAQAEYGRIALQAEEGTATAAQLNAAFKELSAAGKRVADLTAAVNAGTIRDTERETEAAAEMSRAEQEARDAALAVVSAVGDEWNAAVDALKAITARYLTAVSAARTTYLPHELNRKLESQCGTVQQADEIRWRCIPMV
jgi:hypothetical protein